MIIQQFLLTKNKLRLIIIYLLLISLETFTNSRILAEDIDKKTQEFNHSINLVSASAQNQTIEYTTIGNIDFLKFQPYWVNHDSKDLNFNTFSISPHINHTNFTFTTENFSFLPAPNEQNNLNKKINPTQSNFLLSESTNQDLIEEESDADIPYATQKLGRPPEGKFRSLTDDIFPTTKPHFGDNLSLPSYYQWKREISAKYGFDYVITNAPIFQVGSKDANVYFDNELDILAQWRFIETEKTEGKFFFWLQYVQTFSRATGEFAASQNLVTLPNAGATDPQQYVIAVSALWWEQTLADGYLSYRIGQLYAPSLWGTNKYLGDDRITFMNSVLSTTQGVNWPSRGFGATVTIGDETLYASAGFQDATANQNGLDFTSFGDGRFFYLGEIGYTPKINNQHEGAYRLMVSYVDKTGDITQAENRNGWGMILSLQQDLSEQFGVFAIYRQSWERFTSGVFSTAGTGIVINKPFGWDDDQIGIGYFFANPTQSEFRDEHGLEMYYKLQLTHRLELTPSLQIYISPARNSGSTVTPGLRLRYVI